jgi:hypothetical protein
LGAVVFGAALLRLDAISSRGLWYYDEAVHLRSARFFSSFSAARAEGRLPGDLRAAAAFQREAKRAGGERTRTAKPAAETLFAVADSLLGSRDRSCLLASACCGIATVLLLAAAPFPVPFSAVSLVAAALLAVSTWHLHYSRAALSPSVSLLAVTAAMAAILAVLAEPVPGKARAGQRLAPLAAAALLSGLVFTTHYNLFWFPPLAGCAMTVAVLRRNPGLRASLPGLASAWLPRALAPAAFQAASRLPASAGVAAPGYFDQIAIQIFWWSGRRSEWTAGPGEALGSLARASSLPLLILAAAGLISLLALSRRGDLSAGFLSAAVLAPLLIWGAWGYTGPRSFAPALPPVLLGAGALLARLFRSAPPLADATKAWLQVARGSACALVFAALLVELAADLALLGARSPWRETAREVLAIRAAGGPRLDPDSIGFYGAPLLGYYLGETPDASAEGGPATSLLVVDDSLPGGGPLREALLAEARRNGRLVHQSAAMLTEGMIAEEMFPPPLCRTLRESGARIRLWEWTPGGPAE